MYLMCILCGSASYVIVLKIKRDDEFSQLSILHSAEQGIRQCKPLLSDHHHPHHQRCCRHHPRHHGCRHISSSSSGGGSRGGCFIISVLSPSSSPLSLPPRSPPRSSPPSSEPLSSLHCHHCHHPLPLWEVPFTPLGSP